MAITTRSSTRVKPRRGLDLEKRFAGLGIDFMAVSFLEAFQKRLNDPAGGKLPRIGRFDVFL
jgi:hypothetical protein